MAPRRAIQCTGHTPKNGGRQCENRGHSVRYPKPGGYDLERCLFHKDNLKTYSPIFPGKPQPVNDDGDDEDSETVLKKEYTDEEDEDDGDDGDEENSETVLKKEDTDEEAEDDGGDGDEEMGMDNDGDAVTQFERKLYAMDRRAESRVFGAPLTTARKQHIRDSIEPKERLYNLPPRASAGEKISALDGVAKSNIERLNTTDEAVHMMAEMLVDHHETHQLQSRVNRQQQATTEDLTLRIDNLEIKVKDEKKKTPDRKKK
ncbi:hypothetical protein P154DRAFT_524552 [Amniculicola lignicola CBS 123094]|uniref:Uncharacterized protein n=1 Tax=Amniculicola lignicola CBS 123094 TaxID=1392246 RepID=A0A6A5W9P4_9PLEO|nr:hypothetical protein P154DRAFT_524552 [Amniculicola lignicola CBS 123094]